MQEHFCRLQPSLGHVPLSARYSTYTDRFQGKLPVSPTMSPFTDLRRHRPHRQLSLSPRFVMLSSLCRTTTHLATPPTHPPSSSSDHLYATFAIDFASRRQTVFLRLRERRSLV